MRRSLRNEPIGADVSATEQFEGRTAEEAVARARAALGDCGALRCWKTRRGGVGGFFAREVYVASLTPPPGSERGKSSRARRRSPVVDGTKASTLPDVFRRELPDQSIAPDDHLFGLVEGTADQVSLGSLAIPDEAFDEVLAEAQAALARDAGEKDDGTPHPPSRTESREEVTDLTNGTDAESQGNPVDEKAAVGPDCPTDPLEHTPESSPPDAGPTAGDTAVAANAPSAKKARTTERVRRTPPVRPPAAAGTPTARGRPAPVPDLRRGLRGLGVPAMYLPPGRRPSLDQFVGALEHLPVPPSLPAHAGAVVAVVGSGPHIERTLDVVMPELALGSRDVIRPGDPTHADGARLRRQITRRRGAGNMSLVVIPASPVASLRPEVSELLEQASPDYVLAAVGACSKRVDVEHWIGGFRQVDALALWQLSGTRTPAELLGLHPIAFVDGRPSSALVWTLALAMRATEDDR